LSFGHVLSHATKTEFKKKQSNKPEKKPLEQLLNSLINAKILNGTLREFFGTNPLKGFGTTEKGELKFEYESGVEKTYGQLSKEEKKGYEKFFGTGFSELSTDIYKQISKEKQMSFKNDIRFL
jgi:hypothetical protein